MALQITIRIGGEAIRENRGHTKLSEKKKKRKGR